MSVLQGSVYEASLVSDSDLSAATVTCTVTAPDGTTPTLPAPTITSTVATLPIPATIVGTYLLVWSSSGTVNGAQQDQFTCVPAEADLISLPDLKDQLRITATDSREDTQLRAWLRAATNVVENITGPLRVRTVVDVFNGGVAQIVLSDFWVTSITSVVEHYGSQSYSLTEQPLGASSTSYGYTWDRDSNLLTRRNGSGTATFFAPGMNSVVVTYRAGFPVMPDDIQMATTELIRHWRNRARPYQSGPYSSSQNDDNVAMAPNYLVPNAVMEILEPRRRPPSIY